MIHKGYDIQPKQDGPKGYIINVITPEGSNYYAVRGKLFTDISKGVEAAKKEIDEALKKKEEERKKRLGSDNAEVEPWLADPMKLKAEVKKDLGIKDQGETGANVRPKPDPISGIQSATDFYMRAQK